MGYIIIGQPKNFERLQAGEDEVYLIDPNSTKVVPTKVKSKRTLRRSASDSVIELEIYKLIDIEAIDTKAMDSAKEEYNTAVTWKIRVLGSTVLGPVTLPNVGVPTIISADKKELEKWMNRSMPRKKKIF